LTPRENLVSDFSFIECNLYRYGADEDAVVVSSVIFQLKNAKRLLKAGRCSLPVYQNAC
jgi:hypothetical protein